MFYTVGSRRHVCCLVSPYETKGVWFKKKTHTNTHRVKRKTNAAALQKVKLGELGGGGKDDEGLKGNSSRRRACSSLGTFTAECDIKV